MRFENTKVYNIGRAVYSARNPLNSWGLSDSDIENDILGEKDLALAIRLVKAGSAHRKFMRQIFVTVDITAPMYWWSQFDTYKIATVSNSCSKMHTLAKSPITSDSFEHGEDTTELLPIVNMLETLRLLYIERKDENTWRKLVGLLPQSWLQRRTITLSYENILSMYRDRSAHKLKEWREDFCLWVNSLPYARELLTGVW